MGLRKLAVPAAITLMTAVVLGATALLTLQGCFIQGVVPSESGFEGAVTVVSEESDGLFGVVTVRVPYKGVRGDAKTGLARLVIHKSRLLGGKKTPAFCHVHYEKDAGGAKHWARKGWAVFTAVYTPADGESPIDVSVGNGNNLARAVIQWARRCPFVDRTRLHIDGGSQGGYMALEMSADMFPVTSTTADAPVVNWAYNLAYIEANRALSGYPDHLKESPMPVLGAVTMLADWAYQYFPKDMANDAWYHLSPVSYLDRIANPVLLTAATGDMLVPMEQMTRTRPLPVDLSRFPAGYRRGFDELTVNEKARKTFEECLPPEKVFVHTEPLQPGAFEFTAEMVLDPKKIPGGKPKNIERAWSPDHQWSLFYMDEGGPAPQAGHTTYYWSTSPDGFVGHYQKAAPAPSVLNAAKLLRLMERYAGALSNLPVLADGAPANRLNFSAVEQRDVAAGLADYAAMGPEHAANLRALYAACPLKPLGEALPADILP